MGTYYTPQEEKELNAELKKLQNRAKRLILSNYYDVIANELNETEVSILTKVTNAESHKDISWYLWNSGMIERVLDRVAEKIKKAREYTYKQSRKSKSTDWR